MSKKQKEKKSAHDAWVLVTKSGRPIMHTLSIYDENEPKDLFYGESRPKWTRKYYWGMEEGVEAYYGELERRGYRVVKLNIKELVANELAK